jgi:hypothetical protein
MLQMPRIDKEQKIIPSELNVPAVLQQDIPTEQATSTEDSSDTSCGVDLVNHCCSLSFSQQMFVLL